MKGRSAIYFEKRYCLLVHSLVLNQKIAVAALSTNSSEKEVIDRTCSFNINQIVYLNCIDAIKDGVTTSDVEATLHFSSIGDKFFKKNDIASIKFDMNQEKVVKPQSSVLFSKELKEGRGILHYKFINLKTKTLTQDEFESNRQRRTEHELEFSRDEHSSKVEEMMRLLKQKDELIERLQKKIQSLIIENKRKTDLNLENREQSKEKPISLHVKVNTANDNIRKQNERLHSKLREMQEKMQEFEKQMLDYSKEKETYEREVVMLKKQNEKLQKVQESRVRVKGKATSFVNQPSFLRNSNADMYAMNQSNADWIQSQQNPTKITINQPSKNIRPSFIHQESDITHKSNKSNSPQNSHNKLISKASMFASSYIPMNSQLNHNQREQSQYEMEQSNNPNSNLAPADEHALEKRISMQREDLKWTSIIFQRNEEIQILKRKLESRANDLKNLEKQLEKSKIQLKKKDTQIKEMRKQSRKNLFFGEAGSSKQLGKNRSDLQLQFEKMQAEHDSEKVRLEQEIERLEKERQDRDKELKRIKTALSEKAQRQKTAEAKYNELKKFTQKKEDEFIEYREKSQQYDLLNIRNKDLQGMLKNLDSRCQIFEKENKKLVELGANVNARLKELQRDWDRLKKMQRDFEFAKNQNINYIKSIESYESRYNELKKYCIKIEQAYNKFVTSKKKIGSQSRIMVEDTKQEKEIQQKFMELSKKINDCEVTYYAQQIEDFNEEKSFLKLYFQRRLREEKDRILETKEMSDDDKKSAIIEKEKEIQRNISDKTEEIRIKISKLQRASEEANNRMRQSRDSGFNKPIPEQLRIMQKKLSMFQEREQERVSERKNLKQTIAQLNDQLKRASSSAHLQIQSQTLGKNASKNQLLLSMINENRQKASLLEQARQRSEVSQQKTYEQNRKLNTQLVKENGQLKMKNQKLGMDLEKVERKAVDREKQLEQTFKKSENDFKLKNDKLSEQIEKLTSSMESLNQKYSDQQSAVSRISEEATNLSYELEGKEKEIQKLEQKIIYYEQRMEQYEKSERMMLDEVSQIKKDADHGQQELFNLIESRSDNFARIEKVKQVEIEKLKGIIRELQVKIEAEMYENIKCKDKIQEMKASYENLEKETQQKLEVQKLDLDNKQAVYERLYMKEFHTSKENQILQENLLEISTQIENKESQVATLTYELTKLNKQMDIYKKQCQNFEDLEFKYKDEIKGLQLLLDDKIQQIRSFEEKYRQLQMDIEYSAKDMQRIALSNLKSETSAKEYQEKYMTKQQEIIHIQRQYSMLEIEMKKQQNYYANQEKENEALQELKANLEIQIARLNKLNTELSSPMPLKVSRRVSVEADKFDCPSPGRRKNPKRTTNLEVPQVSGIGAGGITPILPASPTPLIRKISQNPFQPREQLRKTKVPRGVSIEYHEIQHKNDEIAIHVEQPIMEAMKSNRNGSHVQIDFFQDVQDSIRFTNSNALKSSFKKSENPIEQELEENQQHSGGFGHNIELGDSKEGQSLQQKEYEDQMRELQRQLIYSNEENQKLNVEVIELTKKVDELMMQVQPTAINRSHYASLGVSRRKPTLEPPPVFPKENTEKQSSEGRHEKLPDPSIHRSNSGVELNTSHEGTKQFINGANFGELQQQYEAAELEIQYLTNEFNIAKNELDEHMKNNQRLIEEAELCRETIEELNNKLEEAQFQIEQTKHYLQFQQLYNQQKEMNNELSLKIEELNSQIFTKETHISTLMNENAQIMEQVNETRSESVLINDTRIKSEHKVKELTQTINRLKVQYRKYEESAELEIVRLHEANDILKSKCKEKEDELTALGEEYLILEGEKDELGSYLEQRESNTKKKEYSQNQTQAKCKQLEDELSKTDQSRQNLFRTIKQLQLQLSQKDDRTKNLSNDTAMVIKKYEIKLESCQQELQQYQSKIAQKQKTITLLKNEIALYNQQCSQLKSLNEELTYQETKVEKELKDIMNTYSNQMDSYKQVIIAQEKEISNLKSVVGEKQNQYHSILKSLRSVEKERDNFQSEYLDMKTSHEKLRSNKIKESNELYVQMQYKNSECQQLKSTIDQITKELESKTEISKQETFKYENNLRAYKEKLQKYEQLVEQFHLDLKKVEERPTIEAHEQILFQNELLRNNIDELQEQLRGKGDTKEKQEMIYMEFRKYKANKEREIQDLQSQMEKYGIKINELQESTFFLKRQNETLKRQINNLNETKEDLTSECEDLRESLQQVEKELQFYKKRKLLDMQKLLNDTQ